MAEEDRDRTALDLALAALGDRWSLLVVDALLAGPRRFGELQAAVPGIAPNVLTARLRSLEQHGILVAEPYSQRPLRYRYELTARGEELAEPLRLLAAWGAGKPLDLAITPPPGGDDDELYYA
jgi:DNA-binding HxlR family transcriptional regulator